MTSKNIGIYAVVSMLQEVLLPCQRHKHAVHYSVLALGTHPERAKVRQTVPKMTSKRTTFYRLFFPPQTPINLKTWKKLGGSAAGMRLATASCMPPPDTASPDFRADAHRPLCRITWPSISSQGGFESYWVSTILSMFLNIFMELELCWKPFFLELSGEGLFPKAPAKGFAAHFNVSLRGKTPLCKDFSE